MTIAQDFISTHATASFNANDLAEEFNGKSGPAESKPVFICLDGILIEWTFPVDLAIEWIFPDGSRATVVTWEDMQEAHEIVDC